MFHLNRDMGINYIQARKDHACYGMCIGIIILDDVHPGFPGDVRNASAFPYPVQYEIVRGVDIKALLWAEDKPPSLESILCAAKSLEKMGCRAIADECGYFAYLQKTLPVTWLCPFLCPSCCKFLLFSRLSARRKTWGSSVFKKDSSAADEYHCEEFNNLWSWEKRKPVPEAYYDKAEQEIIRTCMEFVQENPGIGCNHA